MATLQRDVHIVNVCLILYKTHTGSLKSRNYCPLKNSSTAHSEHLFSETNKQNDIDISVC